MKKRQILITAVVVGVLALLAYLQFRTWRQFHWSEFWEQTRAANPLRILSGIALIYTTYILRAIRWKVLLRPSKDVPSNELVAPMVIGFTAVAVLGRPGDLIRPYLISRRQGLTFSSQVAVLAVERVFDTGCFALLLVMDLLFAPSLKELHHYNQFRFAGELLCGAVLAVAALMFLIWRSSDDVAEWVQAKLSNHFPNLAKSLSSKIRTFGEGLHTIHDLNSFVQIFMLSLAIWLIIALSYVEVTHAYGDVLHTMSVSHVMLLMSASIIGSLLQLPMVGGGSQLGTISMLRTVFDVKEELAASCGLMLWLVTFVSIVPVGLLWSRVEHVSLAKLEQQSKEDSDQ